jgi:hypothetical protein
MSTTEVNPGANYSPRQEPRPEHPIIHDGGRNEVRDLIQAGQNRHLTDAERLRLAGLTFTTDETLERVRLIRDRHPDLYGLVPSNVRSGLLAYEAKRAGAVTAGKSVADPPPAVVAAVDAMASEYRAAAAIPARFVDLDDRHRALFRSAIAAGDFAAVVTEWSAWLAEHAERNAHARRRGSALSAFGVSTWADVRLAPSFIPELEDALGGGTIRETMPIIQRP